MPDNLKRKQPEDPTKININQDWEITYWCDKLGTSEAKLKAAVKAVGPMTQAVRKYLGK
jgi:hypothetical protein